MDSSLDPHLIQHAIPAVQATQVEVLQLLQLLLCTGSHALCLLPVCRSITANTTKQQAGKWASQEPTEKHNTMGPFAGLDWTGRQPLRPLYKPTYP